MKVFVTGGAGFIGSNLTEKLVCDGYEVSIADNLASGKEENLATIRKNTSFHKETINNDMKKILDGVEVVFHVAALPRVQFSIHNPIESHHANISGSLIS